MDRYEARGLLLEMGHLGVDGLEGRVFMVFLNSVQHTNTVQIYQVKNL